MELLIFLLVVAAAVVLALGPLFGRAPVDLDDDPAAPPSDRAAVMEDLATGKLATADLSGEEDQR
ncbi:MAG: hypothetical protein M0Z66_10990 [Thermaerobacter sp.]|nr:hypothetical protein [Thermaerobacter sp.]